MNLYGFGAIDVTKPYEFMWFGDLHGSKPYKSIGFRGAFISQTPVLNNLNYSPTGWGGLGPA
jgi:hypothetical protein